MHTTIMKTKAKPRLRGNTASFSVVVPAETFETLENAPSDLTWRQLAQEAIKAFAAQLPKQKAPEGKSLQGALGIENRSDLLVSK